MLTPMPELQAPRFTDRFNQHIMQIARGEAAQDLDHQKNYGCRGEMRANPRQPLRYLKTPKERAGVSGFIQLGDSRIKPPEQFRGTTYLGLTIPAFKTQPNTVS